MAVLMRSARWVCVLVGMMFINLSVWAQPNTLITLSDESARQLAFSDQWLKLGHYKPSGFQRSLYSAIHSESFFLAQAGRSDPIAELQATLTALQAPPDHNRSNTHAQCRFPARDLWLRSQLPDLMRQPVIDCPDFQQWSGQDPTPVQSASLIFIEGYLGNPSSFFGHVLLRLNRDDAQLDRPQLLATTLNFGVDLPTGEDPLLYFWRGTTGGYDAVFTQAQFHQHQFLYGDFQHRDLWEYRLALTPEQVALLTAHSWELLGQDFRYFFTGANCAYRTASVLEVVLPADISLSNRIKPWTMPHDTFSHLMAAKQAGQPLVRQVFHHPALNTQRVAAWRGLSLTQRQAARKWSKQPQIAPHWSQAELTLAEQAQILDTLILDQATSARFANRYPEPERWQALLQARATLPVQELPQIQNYSQPPTLAEPQPVHRAHFPTRIALGAALQEDDRWGSELQLRVNYYDLLSRPVGRPALGELVLFDARLGLFESKLAWQQFDLMRVTSLNVSPSGLWQEQPISGRFRLGYERLGCSDCGTWLVEGGPGLAWGKPQQYAFYTFLEGRLNTGNTGPVAITPKLGWLQHWHPGWSTHFEAGLRWQAQQGSWGRHELLQAGVRYGDSARWDVRLHWRSEQSQQWQLQLGTYW